MMLVHWCRCILCIDENDIICRLKFDDANDLLDKYYAIAKDSGGDVTYDEFAKYLHLPKSDALEEVFNLYDRVIRISEFLFILFFFKTISLIFKKKY